MGSISGSGLTLGSSVLSNPTGSAPLFGVRAWAQFNGQGSVGANMSMSGGNVSSVYKVANGQYRVNFAVAMPDTAYSAVVMAGQSNSPWSRCTVDDVNASYFSYSTQNPTDPVSYLYNFVQVVR